MIKSEITGTKKQSDAPTTPRKLEVTSIQEVISLNSSSYIYEIIVRVKLISRKSLIKSPGGILENALPTIFCTGFDCNCLLRA
jgi:hypothetical protein